MRRVGSCLVFATAGLAVAAGLAVVPGCSSSSDQTTAESTVPADASEAAGPTTEPTAIVPDGMVTAGLAGVRAHASTVREALVSGDQQAAKDHAKELYNTWYTFEATVRQNEKDLYLQMEDGLADIQAGARDNKVDRIDKGVKALEEGATAYLGKHP